MKKTISFLLSFIIIISAICVPLTAQAGSYKAKYDYGTNLSNEVSNSEEMIDYYFGTQPEDLLQVENAIDAIYKEIDINNLKTDFDKYLAIYQWMTTNVIYKDVPSSHSSVYDALVSKQGVCGDFAVGFLILCRNANLKYTEDVTGTTSYSWHAWNMVKVDGYWYFVDCSTGGFDNYEMFLFRSSDFPSLKLDEQYTTSSFTKSHPTTDVQFDYAKYGINTSGKALYPDNFTLSASKDCTKTTITVTWNKVDGAICYVPYVTLFKENSSSSVTYTLNNLANVDGVSRINNVKSFYTDKDTLSFTVDIPTDSIFTEQKIYGYEFFVQATLPDYTTYQTNSFVTSAKLQASHSLQVDTTTSGTGCNLTTTTHSVCNNSGCTYDNTTVETVGHKWGNATVTTNPTCAKLGTKVYTCSVCKATKSEPIAKLDHNSVTTTTPATYSTDGSIVTSCTTCKSVLSTAVIPKASEINIARPEIKYTGTVQRTAVTVTDSTGKALTYKKDFTVSYSNINSTNVGTYQVTVNFIGNYSGSETFTYKIVPQTNVTPTLNRTTITYTGTVQRPTVTVKDVYGNQLTYKKDFTVSYSNINSTAVGRYTVTVNMIGNYSGSKTYTYYINPKGTSLSSVSAVSKGFTVKWNKQSNQTTGYQIQYATRSDFSNAATVYGGNANTTSKTITGRAGNTRYYVRVRTYKNIGGKYYYSSWSSAKSVVTSR